MYRWGGAACGNRAAGGGLHGLIDDLLGGGGDAARRSSSAIHHLAGALLDASGLFLGVLQGHLHQARHLCHIRLRACLRIFSYFRPNA